MGEATDRERSAQAGARKPLSKRVRFEVFKRDGFRCRYCGATPDQRLLQVDHIVAVANGGTNAMLNLATSCQPCNAGKGATPLELRPKLVSLPSAKETREQLEQIRAYLEIQRETEAARESVLEEFARMWEQQIGPLSEEIFGRLRIVLASTRHELILKAIGVTGQNKGTVGQEFDGYTATQQQKYFSAVLRNMKDGREWRRW
jgi:hypothetical protein